MLTPAVCRKKSGEQEFKFLLNILSWQKSLKYINIIYKQSDFMASK
jgi:hypothetical protein